MLLGESQSTLSQAKAGTTGEFSFPIACNISPVFLLHNGIQKELVDLSLG